jgi:hypothetical protein
MLAVATGFLALTTSRDVTATETIARETEADRRERNRPRVIGWAESTNSGKVRVKVQNIGLAPAVGVLVTAESQWADVGLRILPILLPASVEPVSLEVTPPASFNPRDPRWTKEPPPHALHGNFVVGGHYSDAVGTRYEIVDWIHQQLTEADEETSMTPAS